MNREQAKKMLAELLAVECRTVHAENSSRGISKTLAKREVNLTQKVFQAMTQDDTDGFIPLDPSELDEVIPR